MFPEKGSSSVLPGLGIPARPWYRLSAFGETLLLEPEQDLGVRVEGLTAQDLGQATKLLGGVELGTYLTGTINGDPESVASLHWAKGALLGVLQYRGTKLQNSPWREAPLICRGAWGSHPMLGRAPPVARAPCAASRLSWEPQAQPPKSQALCFLSRFVETLVAADDTMAALHGTGLKRHLLTVLAAAKASSIRASATLSAGW
uniref:Uncharacterized protein n=1 Tax=Molossus molossus TaxID=27622 RepID=A0A7J8FS16_MOLMO|nr:hypothetical protein HJG59_008334 [Molossus molossus]